MTDMLYLAWRSLSHYWSRTLLLSAALAVAIFVPSALLVTMQKATWSLTQRAKETPLLLGTAGSVTDLTLRALYFSRPTLEMIKLSDLEQIDDKLADAIPLHLRFYAQHRPVMGTTLEYLHYRQLKLIEGEPWQRLGDCILGYATAANLKLKPGDSLMTDADSIVNLAGSYPLRMRVTGVLEPTDSPDDDAVFIEIETAWVIEGIGHGHAPQPIKSDEPHAVARPYIQVTEENVGSFHFHGSRNDYPLSAAIILPRNDRAQTLLLGQFESLKEKTLQMAEPPRVMNDLLRSILRIRWLLLLGAALIGLATIALVVLVFSLSFKLRQRELDTLRKIGASRRRIAVMLAGECFLVTTLAILLSAILTWSASQFDQSLIRWLL